MDQNFRLRDETGAECVLKIMNAMEDPAFLEAQVSALEVLQSMPGRLRTPQVVPNSAGLSTTLEGSHAVWLVTYLPGQILADLSRPPEGLLHDLGAGLGDLDRRLAGFDHPGARRVHRWDLRNAPGALSFTEHIADAAGREAVRSGLSRFESRVLPEVDRLPFQVIHNDANDHNLIVEGEGPSARVSGLLDFGDLVWTARACEPAIAMTYPMLSAADPVQAGALVLAGYHEALCLDRQEIRAIPYLIEARLCVSVTMSAYRRKLDPGNEYLAASEAPAWNFLDWMMTNPPSRWVDAFEAACASVRVIGSNDASERATDES